MRRIARRWPLRGFRADAALALALAAAALTLLAAGDADAIALAVVATLLVTVPLAWRRRSPLAAVLLVYLGMALLPRDGETFVLLPALAIAFFSAAAQLDGRGAALAFAGGLLALAVNESRQAEDVSNFLENFFFIVTVFGAISIAGRLVRRDRLRAAELEALTVELEREREEKARLAVAQERTRIARELHDVVAHGVSVMVVQAGARQGYVREDPDQAEAALDSIRHAGMQALAELRRMLGLLRSSDHDPEIVPQPGIGQAGALVENTRRGGLDVELELEGEPRELPAGLDVAAYRVVQEALTNVVKHAGGAPTTVTVRYLPEVLELEVVNAPPADADSRVATATAGAGHGHIGMRERVALYGGDLDLGPDSDGGYRVRARLPVAQAPT